MSDKSAIEWTDATWNPTIGCTRVSAGCEHCYAEKRAYRNAVMGNADYQGLTRKHADGSVNWTGEVRMLTERLEQPLHWRTPRRVFVDSMSDLFHEQVPPDFIARAFGVMGACWKHTFQILTKRPERMRALLRNPFWQGQVYHFAHEHLGEAITAFELPLPNVWLGVSVEDQPAADERIPLLLDTPATVRFLSCEPLLGPLELRGWLSPDIMLCPSLGGITAAELHESENARALVQLGKAAMTTAFPQAAFIDWVIVGGESGGPIERQLVERFHVEPEQAIEGQRTWWDPRWPEALSWVRSIRDQCQAAGVAFFFKQWGGPTPKAGGRLLDGRAWDEFPTILPNAVAAAGVIR